MHTLPRFTWLPALVLSLALVTALFVGPLLVPLLTRPARPTTAFNIPTTAAAARPAVAPARSAYRTLLTVSALSYLLLGALGLAMYRRSRRARHWHPRVGGLSPVQVLPSGELSQPVSRYIRPYARRAVNPRLG